MQIIIDFPEELIRFRSCSFHLRRRSSGHALTRRPVRSTASIVIAVAAAAVVVGGESCLQESLVAVLGLVELDMDG